MSRRPGLTFYILLALVLGALVGWLWPAFGRQLQVLATIFIRLVMMIIAPLIFSTLVVGIAGSGELKKLGAMAVKTVAYFLILTAVALALSFAIGNWLQPGQGIAPPTEAGVAPSALPEGSFWVRLLPTSVVDAMARGYDIQIVVVSVVFAVAASFGLLLGIDPILVMPRTGVNTAGNCLATLVARWQGSFRQTITPT